MGRHNSRFNSSKCKCQIHLMQHDGRIRHPKILIPHKSWFKATALRVHLEPPPLWWILISRLLRLDVCWPVIQKTTCASQFSGMQNWDRKQSVSRQSAECVKSKPSSEGWKSTDSHPQTGLKGEPLSPVAWRMHLQVGFLLQMLYQRVPSKHRIPLLAGNFLLETDL
jgi:hypothetical protein